ncbi:hypothetical protein GFL88_18260 [Rhizobium leguminosarum bv. viciae]|uniref:hypothetical protein n=1 Tax=Rhizobium leguminosarum TaxID=384 RepID=UPI001441F008|nr:hypothetical protein [Rhizobium leguminosarum]NKK65441.1 hypothetical protein [Rhizobium leguminosarum bv. viciae]
MANRFGVGAISVAKWEVDDGFFRLTRPQKTGRRSVSKDIRGLLNDCRLEEHRILQIETNSDEGGIDRQPDGFSGRGGKRRPTSRY